MVLHRNQGIQEPSQVDYMICPFHLLRLEEKTSPNGFNYVKCPGWPCLLFCTKDEAENYMSEVYKNVHPDICDRWNTMNCLCGNTPTLRQSHSEKNPNRLYLSCGANADQRCKFFRWADQQIRKYDPSDPLSVHQWLTGDAKHRKTDLTAPFLHTKVNVDTIQGPRNQYGEIMYYNPDIQDSWYDALDPGPGGQDQDPKPPAPPPCRFCDSLTNFHKRQETVHYEKPKTLRIPGRPDTVIPDHVKNWYNQTGLF